MKYSQAQTADSFARLNALVLPGMTVYTVLNHVSRSGMMRHISAYILSSAGVLENITEDAAVVTGRAIAPRGVGMKVGGCGMDAGFEVVYNLAFSLYKPGFTCVGQGCPSNDHSNGDRDCTPHLHSDAGYSLKHEWANLAHLRQRSADLQFGKRTDQKMRQYRKFTSLEQLRDYAVQFGGHWFDPDAMSSFNSRIHLIAHGASPADWNIFISSERGSYNGGRREYTLRQLLIDGSTADLSENRAFTTLAAARRALDQQLQIEAGAPAV